jgi:hypothetical protein
VGKPEGKRPLGTPRHRWENKIMMNLQDVGWGAWTVLICLRTGTGGGHLCGNEPLGSVKYGEFLDYLRTG